MAEALSAVEVGHEVAEHAKHAGSGGDGEFEAHAGHNRALSIAEAVLLSPVTLMAAWSGYAAAKWSPESRVVLAQASATRTTVNRASLQAILLRNSTRGLSTPGSRPTPWTTGRQRSWRSAGSGPNSLSRSTRGGRQSPSRIRCPIWRATRLSGPLASGDAYLVACRRCWPSACWRSAPPRRPARRSLKATSKQERHGAFAAQSAPTDSPSDPLRPGRRHNDAARQPTSRHARSAAERRDPAGFRRWRRLRRLRMTTTPALSTQLQAPIPSIRSSTRTPRRRRRRRDDHDADEHRAGGGAAASLANADADVSRQPSRLHLLGSPRDAELTARLGPDRYGELVAFLSCFCEVVLLDLGTGVAGPLARSRSSAPISSCWSRRPSG